MPSSDTPTHCFQLRAAAIVRREGTVLLHQAAGDTFWALPGGRVEPGESAAAALARELREELSVQSQIGELALLVENFFEHSGTHSHEIGFYFAVSLALESRLLNSLGPFRGVEKHRDLTFDWFTPAQLSRTDVRPSCLRSALSRSISSFTHIVHHDRR